MGYQIRRGGRAPYQSYLKETAFRDIDDPENPDPDKRKWTDDRDWTGPTSAHEFENENDAHEWVRKHAGQEGQLSVLDRYTGELIEDLREGFDKTVDRYLR